MASLSDWKVPTEAQPNPADYAYDLDAAMSAVVGLRAVVPEDAFTAQTLGTERAGNGVLIRDDGLVLTIGYLITEAESIWLSPAAGPPVPGHALAYDQETGFGLVQALAPLDLPAAADRRTRAACKSAIASLSPASADASARWRRASSPSRNSPAIGNMCSTRRSSRRRRIPTGAAPR